MNIYNLSSGSKGNATLIECDNFNILIDAGGTKKYLINSLAEIGKSINDIDMVLVTHFHTDHSKNLNYFSNEIIYSQKIEHKSLGLNIDNDFYGISIKPFALSHDESCLGFQIKENNETYTHISDTGYIKNEYISLISESDYLYLEFNHDIQMLRESNRPAHVKKRILSDKGHMNNQDAAIVLAKGSNKLKEVLIAHISEEANTISAIKNEIDKVFSDFNKTIDFKIKYTAHQKVIKCGDCSED
ncbi:phosphoribosyl 1,2-cyclic phosphodiesterase [Bacilli bacterium PM5-3]|nr:phosphoribosyl 1,2-cyclic phosphodiesterase [Bacilli bacterium PM5-3]MDH6603381.1 phosphoribosyl 1,2-cyclic phosphodiesterase [Bacilli bacterium PM5-9]